MKEILKALLKAKFAYSILISFAALLLAVTPRNESVRLFVLVLILAAVALFVAIKNRSRIELLIYFVCARLPFLLTVPLLSDDYFRFNWDALLSANGFSPFSFLPAEMIGESWAKFDVFVHLNSPEYYSVYPSTMQCFFSLALLLSNAFSFVFALKFIVFILELLMFNYLVVNIKRVSGNVKYLVLITMLPIVYMEGLGNLHFEVVMMNLFLLAYCLVQSENRVKKSIAPVVLTLSILTKLTVAPLALVFAKNIKQFLFTGIVIIVVSVLLFLPYVDSESINAFKSLGLYFNNFEFNASIYYLVRALGFEWVGYNIVALYGTVFKVLLLFVLLYLFLQRIVYKRNNQWMFKGLNVFFMIYCLANPTLHPWYLIVPLYLTVFTKSRFWIYWSVCIALSYSFYQNHQQIGWWLYAEYGLLLLLLIIDKLGVKYKANCVLTKGGILSRYF